MLQFAHCSIIVFNPPYLKYTFILVQAKCAHIEIMAECVIVYFVVSWSPQIPYQDATSVFIRCMIIRKFDAPARARALGPLPISILKCNDAKSRTHLHAIARTHRRNIQVCYLRYDKIDWRLWNAMKIKLEHIKIRLFSLGLIYSSFAQRVFCWPIQRPNVRRMIIVICADQY